MEDGKIRRRSQPSRQPDRARSHNEERAARLDLVETWLAQRLSRSEIVAECRKRWHISPRQADRYLQAAAARLQDRAEPEREENRRRNLATIDYGIGQACRLGKLRDLAALVKLRSKLDGSMEPAPAVAQSAPDNDLSPAELAQVLADQLVAMVSLTELTPELRQSIADTIRPLVRETDTPSASESEPRR